MDVALNLSGMNAPILFGPVRFRRVPPADRNVGVHFFGVGQRRPGSLKRELMTEQRKGSYDQEICCDHKSRRTREAIIGANPV